MSIFQKKPDYVLISVVFFLLAFGFVMLSSASTAVAFDQYGDSYFFLKRQFLFGGILGTAAFFIMSRIDYRYWKKVAFPLLLLTLALLIAVFLPGIGTNLKGAHRWITIAGLTFQPSEAAKLTFLLYLCTWLEARGKRGVADFSYGFIPFLTLLGAIVLLIILQPDVGTMSIILVTALAVYFVGGASWKHLALFGAVGAALFALLIAIAPYRTDRFTIFLHPELDPQGVGYHINQAFLAIGSGGFWGRGFGESRQKFQYLPEVAGDSIFAVMAEELGFFFVTLLISAFLLLLYRGFRISANAPDAFGKLVAAGITTWVVAQAFLNIMAMTGLVPLTGLPLPFISHGSTSLVVILAAMGILTNISQESGRAHT